MAQSVDPAWPLRPRLYRRRLQKRDRRLFCVWECHANLHHYRRPNPGISVLATSCRRLQASYDADASNAQVQRLLRSGLSTLNCMAFGLAAYASQCGLLQHLARLAFRCWSGSTGRAFHPHGSAEWFQSCRLHLILLSQAFLTQWAPAGAG